MSAASTHRRTLPSEGDGSQLEAIAEELRRRGWSARVVRRSIGGELDVRLRVAGSRAPAVELLDAWGTRPCGHRWQAVLIAPHRRVVWCGPDRPCPADELLTFVEDLLRLDEHELTARYTSLG